ncbi:PIN-like domain-containing protein [Hyalangium gracile]|uniref:PIN-like domain-containing protein n=1 Tax=Hyalangium gracile TaxID=394092 RepID=UPI001CCF1F19|nr:PIN-like domain-containing protein [Hyalangium gracile]
MRDLFRGYYRLSTTELNSSWADCTFVLDANVLLDLHRYPEKPREELLLIFTKIKDRLWVPFQAALEYEANRLGVIQDQIRRFQDVLKIVAESKANLSKKIGELQLSRRHASINPSKFLKEIERHSDNFIAEIEELRSNHPMEFMSDAIRDQIGEILSGRIGPPPESQVVLDAIQKDAARRYERKEPPGYLDGEGRKTDRVIHNGLLYSNEFGDYILWRQVLDYAEHAKPKAVIYITNDEKEDWWRVVSGQRIGPRPELVEEIYRCAGVTHFHMYNTLQFLEHAGRIFNTKVSKESIRQVRDIAEVKRRGLPPLQRDEFMLALAKFDENLRGRKEWEGFENFHSHKYAIEHDNKLYPVKQVISLATGIPTYEFSGGHQANRRVQELGFTIRELRSADSEQDIPFTDEAGST